MRLGSKEKEVRDLIHEHLNLVKKCVKLTLNALEAHAGGEMEQARELNDKVNETETEADVMRRDIAQKLFEGAFLPMMREPLLEFVKRADRVADAAERVCETLYLTRIDIPEEFRGDIAAFAEDALPAVKALRKAFDAMFEKMADVLDLVHACTRFEHEVDHRQEAIVQRLYASDLPLAHKRQIHELIEQIDDIVDATEDTADVLQVLTVITSV